MPAVVNSTLGSSFSTRGALGSRPWPFASKTLTKRSRISSLLMARYSLGNKNAGATARSLPAFPCPSSDESSESGRVPTLVTRALACLLPLALRLIGELAPFHLRLRGQVLRDPLQLVGATPQLVGALAQLFTCDVARLRRVQQRQHRPAEKTDEEAHRSYSPIYS